MNPRQWSLVKQSTCSLKVAKGVPKVLKQAEAKRDGVKKTPKNYDIT